MTDNHSKDNDPLDSLLHHRTAEIKASDKERDQIANAMQASDDTLSGTASSRNHLTLMVALAAAVLLVIGTALWMRPHDKDKDSSSTASEFTIASVTINQSIVISTQPEQKKVITQDLDTRTISVLKIGSSLGPDTIQSILPQAIILRSKDGTETVTHISQYNDTVLEGLREKIQSAQSTWVNGEMDSNMIGFVAACARFGDASAVKLLETISKSTSPWALPATNVLMQNQDEMAVNRLIETALHKEGRFQRQAIESLAAMDFPAGMACLATLCQSENIELARFTIKRIRSSGGLHAIGLLRMAATQAEDPDVRVMAEDGITSLSRKLTHENK